MDLVCVKGIFKTWDSLAHVLSSGQDSKCGYLVKAIVEIASENLEEAHV